MTQFQEGKTKVGPECFYCNQYPVNNEELGIVLLIFTYWYSFEDGIYKHWTFQKNNPWLLLINCVLIIYKYWSFVWLICSPVKKLSGIGQILQSHLMYYFLPHFPSVASFLYLHTTTLTISSYMIQIYIPNLP